MGEPISKDSDLLFCRHDPHKLSTIMISKEHKLWVAAAPFAQIRAIVTMPVVDHEVTCS